MGLARPAGTEGVEFFFLFFFNGSPVGTKGGSFSVERYSNQKKRRGKKKKIEEKKEKIIIGFFLCRKIQ